MFSHIKELFTRPSGGYTIGKSVRLRSSASAYFNRTPASATNRKTWTWSGWVKRGILGSTDRLFCAGSGSTYTEILTVSDTIKLNGQIAGADNGQVNTVAVFRDPSAWYHIVVAFDVTASTKIIVYINGVSQTLTTTTAFTNQNYEINNTVSHNVGNFAPTPSSGDAWDGYLTEINFIDGQALTPSSFGETDSITGVWKAKKYSGTYGTNGFYLNFSDNSSNTATTIGKDYSGNGNNWTPNNISVTSGATYDSMTDVPTLTSATAANYCVLNPLNKSSSSTVSNGNLRQTSSGGWYRAYSTIFFASTAVFYAEATMTALNSGANGVRVGIANANSVFTYLGSDANSWSYDNQGNKYNNGTLGAYGASYVQGDVIGILFNNGSLTFYKNGASQGVAYSGLTGTFCFAGSPFDTDIVDWNFGQRPFSNLPSGALALNTYNLPASTITNGAGYMAATLVSGVTGGVQTVSNAVNGVSFQPDLIWTKTRSAADNNYLVDSVRGTSKFLQANTTDADGTNANFITAITSSGYSYGSSGYGSGTTLVGWQWKAGGTASSNTNGSITSTVSAGATQGFSVVTYTGTGGTGTTTVGHGLGVAPNMVIIKKRSAVSDWPVYHTSLTSTSYYALLDTTGAQQTYGSTFISPNSTTLTIAADSSLLNTSTATYVAYCFAAVKGFSAFGSYTGNGSTDGPFVYTGFRPRFVMIKRTDSANNWVIYDTARDTFNKTSKYLYAQSSQAEVDDTVDYIDILSNGFKPRATWSALNASGGTYIYMAFAENPTKYALAR